MGGSGASPSGHRPTGLALFSEPLEHRGDDGHLRAPDAGDGRSAGHRPRRSGDTHEWHQQTVGRLASSARKAPNVCSPYNWRVAIGSRPFNRSPAQLVSLIDDLRNFRIAYVPYLNATLPSIMRGEPIAHTGERAKVFHLAVRAEQAVAAAGVRVAVTPPPIAQGKFPISGLAGVAFAHEDPTYRPSYYLRDETPKQSYEYALDAVDSADVLLSRSLEQVRARRRRPTYWVDRMLRAILGFPAYLISLIFGFDRHALSPEKGRILWLLSVAADAAGIFALGQAVGWW